MDPMAMGMGMEAMWQTMFEGMRAMYERGAGDAYSQQQMGMGAAYGAAAGGGQAWGMAGQMPGAQMPGGMAGGMQAAGRDMFGGAYGAKPQAYGGYGVAGQGSRIVVENLPRSMMWQGLKDLFKNFGQVSRADVSVLVLALSRRQRRLGPRTYLTRASAAQPFCASHTVVVSVGKCHGRALLPIHPALLPPTPNTLLPASRRVCRCSLTASVL